jgi:hypothetical protein
MFAIKACKGWRTKAQDVSIMTLNNTNPADLSTLDDISIQTLIDHYLSVAERLPDNVTVRDRLVELQQELLNRTLKADAESEANNRTTTTNE